MPNTPNPYLNINTGPTGVKLLPNTYLPAALAHALVDALPDDVQVPIPGTGMFYINKDHTPQLAELVHEVIAHTVSSLINAGSERDAVMENDPLRLEIIAELHAWANP